MIINFEGLREQLTDEQVKDILLQYNVEPCVENADTIIFPTCCHNLTGGSPKLYYYKDSKRFHCYTECDSGFDIFDLLRRRHKLRGQDISVIDAINICGLTLDGIATADNQQINPQNADDLRYLQVLNCCATNGAPSNEPLAFHNYDKAVLKQFNFDYIGLLPWIEEGIGVEALQRFNIR